MKICIHCHILKPLEDFVKTKQRSLDGYFNRCKMCYLSAERERYHKRWHQEQKRREIKHSKLKISALEAYGSICQCCNESEQSFLTIDHINNDGAKHREQSNVGGGHNFYQWLKNNKYPIGFQVLCMNCNFSKYTNGGSCIHQEQK